MLFVVPGVLAMIVEPIVFLLADRYPRAWFVRGGLAAMSIAALGCALAPSASTLAAAMSLSWVATGTAVALGQATLVDARPDARGQTMARWTLLSTVGDLAAPLLLAGIAVLGLGWRAAFAVIAALLAVATVLATVAQLSPSSVTEDAEPSLPLWVALRAALSDRVLLAWLFAVAMCDLLDEILVVFATIHLRATFAASTAWQSVVVGAGVMGGLVGLVLLERVLARTQERERELLLASACGAGLSLVAWICAPTLEASAVLMVPVGVFAAPLYPLAAAQTFARRPSASGSVLAAGHLFTPLGLALPWLVGLVADRAGTTIALSVLLAQPLIIVVLAWSRAAPSPPASDR